MVYILISAFILFLLISTILFLRHQTLLIKPNRLPLATIDVFCKKQGIESDLAGIANENINRLSVRIAAKRFNNEIGGIFSVLICAVPEGSLYFKLIKRQNLKWLPFYYYVGNLCFTFNDILKSTPDKSSTYIICEILKTKTIFAI